MRHTTENYLFLKVLLPDTLGQPSLMPTFGYAPADAAKIALALESLRKSDLPASYVLRPVPSTPYQPAGRFGELIARYRCLSCHTIAGYGGASTVFLDDRLEAYNGTCTVAETRRGQELYQQLGCRACHQLGSHGGYIGPELSNAGIRLKPGWIAAWLTAPAAYKPGTLQPDYGLTSTAYCDFLVASPVKRLCFVKKARMAA